MFFEKETESKVGIIIKIKNNTNINIINFFKGKPVLS